MKIYALNSMQSHSESVKKNVSLVGSVILRGFETDDDIQLLEGSHRMAYAVELGLPVTIVLFNEDEIIPHDCDDIESPITGRSDRSTAGELAYSLIKERGLYNQAVYESDNYSTINIIKAVDETGEVLHSRLVSNSPFSAFPEKVWVVTFGELKDVVDKDVLVFGKNNAAEAFKTLSANVTFVDAALYQNLRNFELIGKQFDLIYATDIHSKTDLYELFSAYKKLLKNDGLAVTLNEMQTLELISATKLEIYAFLEIQEECAIVSFVKNKKQIINM